MKIDKRRLPEGHHWDLHIEHDFSGGDAGLFTGGGPKIVWHITVSPWNAIDAMVRVLKEKGAEPHFVIGGRAGRKHPVVVQMVELNRAGRSLRNDSADGYQTNRANAIQVEICANVGRRPASSFENGMTEDEFGSDLFCLPPYLHGLASAHARGVVGDLCMTEPRSIAAHEVARSFHTGVAAWTDHTYKALANLTELIRHRVAVPNKCPRSFTSTKRFTDSGFVKTAGYVGHMHTPDNDHIDPTTAFKGSRLVSLVKNVPRGGYDL